MLEHDEEVLEELGHGAPAVWSASTRSFLGTTTDADLWCWRAKLVETRTFIRFFAIQSTGRTAFVAQAGGYLENPVEVVALSWWTFECQVSDGDLPLACEGKAATCRARVKLKATAAL